ncbi:restriction endonuclease subunit S [Alteromonas lipotrueae]|uniref:restriction endonuclease subunit S n=1 Tax=Alteromonas lipotrueae TaxID=2803814 RepID=UPI001C43E744|nr:restriction endonuclease subunit S [Alteromonas lipotrueae]
MSNNINLPQGWEVSQIGEVCEPSQYGYTAKAGTKGNYHYLRTTDITKSELDWSNVPFCEISDEEATKYLLKDNDVVISRAGSIGYSYLISKAKKSVFASYLIRFRPLLNPKYFRYFLDSQQYWNAISAGSSGIAVQNVNAKTLSLIDLPIAPEKEQARIVERLDELFSELDAGVNELKSAQKKLTLYRHSLLKSAVEGVLTQKWRNENKERIDETGAELLERILIEHKERWVQQKLEEFKAKDKTLPKNWQDKYSAPIKPDASKLPELPQGWAWASLSQLVEIIQIGPFGSLLHKSDYISGGIPLINPTHIKNLAIEPDNNLTITEEKRVALNKYVMSEGDIIIGRRGEMGRCALVTDKENGWLCGTGSLFVRLLKSLNPEFYTWVLSSKRTKDYLAEVSVGTTMQNLNQKILHSIPVPLLSKAEQIAASEILHNEYERIDRQIQDIEIALKQSNAQRKNILKSAFSGQLVSQDTNDEPASVLLEKIKKEREELAKQAKPKKTRQPKKKVNMMDTLLEVLTAEDRWIDAQEAFKKCGIVDGTSTDRVEEIYTELRKLEKAGQIEVERNGSYDQIRLIKQAVKED